MAKYHLINITKTLHYITLHYITSSNKHYKDTLLTIFKSQRLIEVKHSSIYRGGMGPFHSSWCKIPLLPLFQQSRDAFDLNYLLRYSRVTTDNTLLCGWIFEPATYITVHVVLRKHFFLRNLEADICFRISRI